MSTCRRIAASSFASASISATSSSRTTTSIGDGVNVAARIESIAKPGGVAVSGAVRDNVGNRLDLAFEDTGEQTLKNIDRPVRVYNVDLLPAHRADRRRTPKASRSAEEKPSIAVLPFNNMSGDPEQEYFSDGITEDIITDLSKISGLLGHRPQLGVHLQGQVRRRAGGGQRASASRFVLEGSVRKAGQRVRITAPADRRQRRRPSLGRPLRPRPHRHLRDPGRDHPHHRRPAEGQAAAGGEEGDRAGADRECRGLYLLSAGAGEFFHTRTKAIPAACATDVRSGRRNSIPTYARAYAGIADCDSVLHALARCGHLARGASCDLRQGAGARSQPRRSACVAWPCPVDQSAVTTEAVAEFERAIALDPNSYEGHYFYARHSFARRAILRRRSSSTSAAPKSTPTTTGRRSWS